MKPADYVDDAEPVGTLPANYKKLYSECSSAKSSFEESALQKAKNDHNKPAINATEDERSNAKRKVKLPIWDINMGSVPFTPSKVNITL